MDVGLIYIIIAEILWAGEIITIRKFFPNANPFFVAGIGSIIGSLFYAPVVFATKQKLSMNNWIVMIVYALLSWFLAQMFYVSGIMKSNNSVAITFATLTLPLSTFLLSAIFLKEPVTPKIIFGGAIMIVGFLIISL